MCAIAKQGYITTYAMTCTQQTLSKTITKATDYHILATTAMLCTQQPLSKTITKPTQSWLQHKSFS